MKKRHGKQDNIIRHMLIEWWSLKSRSTHTQFVQPISFSRHSTRHIQKEIELFPHIRE
jgi:hypothetical protein